MGLVLVALERRWNYGVKVDPCIHMCAIYVSMREREACGSGLVVSVSQTSKSEESGYQLLVNGARPRCSGPGRGRGSVAHVTIKHQLTFPHV